MNKQLFFLFFFLVFSFSCQQNEKNITIDQDSFIYKPIKLSEFANDISYLPIKDSSALSYIDNIQTANNKLFIKVWPIQLKVYDYQGKFLYNIGKEGRGPGEYENLEAFAVDEINKEVYILDNNKILVFSDCGELIRTIDISGFGEDFDDIGFLKDRIILFENINMGYAKYNWLVVDKHGNKMYECFNPISKFKTRSTNSTAVYKFGDHYGYWNHFNDTIYNVSEEGYAVSCLFAKNKYRLTPFNNDDRQIFTKEILRPHSFLESSNYLFFCYYFGRKAGFALINKISGEIQTIEQKTKPNNFDNSGFINDLDGGLNFSPKSFIEYEGNEYLIATIDAVALKSYVLGKSFKMSKPILQKKKVELSKLANKLKEDDNPILVFVKLKK